MPSWLDGEVEGNGVFGRIGFGMFDGMGFELAFEGNAAIGRLVVVADAGNTPLELLQGAWRLPPAACTPGSCCAFDWVAAVATAGAAMAFGNASDGALFAKACGWEMLAGADSMESSLSLTDTVDLVCGFGVEDANSVAAFSSLSFKLTFVAVF